MRGSVEDDEPDGGVATVPDVEEALTCDSCDQELDECECVHCSKCNEPQKEWNTCVSFGCCDQSFCTECWSEHHPSYCDEDHCDQHCECDEEDHSDSYYCEGDGGHYYSAENDPYCKSCYKCKADHCSCVPCGICKKQAGPYTIKAPDDCGQPTIQTKVCIKCLKQVACTQCQTMKIVGCGCTPVVATTSFTVKSNWKYEQLPDAWQGWLPHGMREGIKPTKADNRSWMTAAKEWDIDHTLDPSANMAAFYLAEAIMCNALLDQRGDSAELRMVQAEAKQLQDNVVARCDPSFLAYAQMACWGEVRYHPAVSGHDVHTISHGKVGERFHMWHAVAPLRPVMPAAAWLDIADMFRDYENVKGKAQGSGVGGERWAIAAELVYARLVGRLSPKLFVDRMFNLQHNGGCFLNKIEWSVSPHNFGAKYLDWGGDEPNPATKLIPESYAANYNGLCMINVIGQWHAAVQPKLRMLARVGGPEAESLLRRTIRATNKLRLSWAMPPITQDDPRLAWSPQEFWCPQREAARKSFDKSAQSDHAVINKLVPESPMVKFTTSTIDLNSYVPINNPATIKWTKIKSI